MSLIFKTLKVHRQRFGGFLSLFLLLALITSAAAVAITRLTGDLSYAAYETDNSTLLHFLLIITALFALRAISSAVSALLLGRFAAKAGYRFRDNFVKYFLHKPFAKFEGANSGESLSIYSNDIPAAIELVSAGGLRFFSDIIGLIVTIVYMFILAPFLSLILFVSFPLLIVLQVVIAIPIQSKQKLRSERRAELTAIVNDSLQNTSTIAAYSLEDVMLERCDGAFANLVTATKSYVRSLLPLVMGGMIASMSPTLIVTVVAANRTINGNISMVEFIAFLILSFDAVSWLAMLSQRQNDIQTGAAGATRMASAMEGGAEDLTSGAAITNTSDTVVSAENLTFSYDQENITLDGISFSIKKGSRVAFVGGSGSGKSTVLKLLLGLYPPQEGEISIMGKSEFSLHAQRSAFAYVPQDSFLFPESIGSNITGEDAPDLQKLELACKNAGIWDFIQTLPEKFDAVLSESAENVSGGQKQRIALARAFYRNAPIILFDEATSALDPLTESQVLSTFDSLSSNTTVIMVSHRIKPISFCDTIIVMDSGKIAATGTHDTLMQECEIYKKLYDSQNKSMKEVTQ